MKNFFKKVWAWVLKNKLWSAVIASVVVAGIVCAIVLPIALNRHKHNFVHEVATEVYFVSEDDSSLTYHKSCECGKKGTETFKVNKAVATITNFVMDDLYYNPFAEFFVPPSFDTNSDGTVTVEYKVKGADDSTYSVVQPTALGEYTVRVKIAGTKTFTSVVDTKDFAIKMNVIEP